MHRVMEEWRLKVNYEPLLQGTRVKKSPFFEASMRYGATGFTVYNRYIMPVQWQGQTATDEYWRLVKNVCLWDVSVQRQVELHGPDALALAQYISSRNLTTQKTGTGRYAICTDEDGIVINDPLVLKLSEDRYWFSIADRDLELWAKAIAYTKGFDVKVKELDVPVLALQGPESTKMIEELFGEECSRLKFFEFKEVMWHGMPTLICRAGWSPERGYEIYVRGGLKEHIASRMWTEIVECGKAYGLMFGSPHQARRIEGGMLSSCDYSNTSLNALEMGLPTKFFALETDLEFMGKAALQQKLKTGITRQVVGLEFPQEARFESSMTHSWGVCEHTQHQVVLDEDCGPCVRSSSGDALSLYGAVTSMGYSPRVKCQIGIATVDKSLSQDGTEILVMTPEGPYTATVRAFPFEGTSTPMHKGKTT